MARKNKRFRRFTPEQKYHYHNERSYRPGPSGIDYGGPKHCYSFGFTDGWFGIDNSRATKGEFGAKSQRAYDAGHARGNRAFRQFFKRTGKQPEAVREYK